MPDNPAKANKKNIRLSRIEKLLEANIGNPDYELPMPPLEDGEQYLLQLLTEAGTASSNGMGLSGLSWSELESWCKCLDVELSTWELLLIHTLSREYATEYSLASDKDRPAPYTHIAPEMKQDVDKKLLSALRNFKPSKKKTIKG